MKLVIRNRRTVVLGFGLGLGLLLLSAAGCARYDTQTLVGLKTQPAETRLGSAMYLAPECPTGTEEFAPALVGLVAGFGAQFAVSAVGEFITQYRDGLTGQFIASGVSVQSATSGAGAQPQPALADGACLIIARGLYGPTPPDLDTAGSDLSRSDLARLGLADQPAFYMELRTTVLTESVVLTPVYVGYGASSARTLGSGSKNLAVVIAMSEETIAKADDVKEENAFAVFRHNLGRLKVGSHYNDPEGDDLLRGTAASQPKPEQFGRSSFNLVALVTESEEPSIALKALAETFDSKKGDIQTALENFFKGLFPSEEDKQGSGS